MKKSLILVLSSLFLFSCKKETKPYDCYQCYVSNMIESTFSLSYDKINKKEILHETFLDDEKYYGNYYIINSQEELNDFYNIDNLQIDEKEKENYSLLPTSSSMSMFIVQIPKGYKVEKRSNIQQELNNKDVILVTTNFYYYSSHPEIVYSHIDLKKDETIKENYTYSYFYIYNYYYSSIIKENSIRFIYNLVS